MEHDYTFNRVVSDLSNYTNKEKRIVKTLLEDQFRILKQKVVNREDYFLTEFGYFAIDPKMRKFIKGFKQANEEGKSFQECINAGKQYVIDHKKKAKKKDEGETI